MESLWRADLFQFRAGRSFPILRRRLSPLSIHAPARVQFGLRPLRELRLNRFERRDVLAGDRFEWPILYPGFANSPYWLDTSEKRAPSTRVDTPLARIAPQHIGQGSNVV